MPSANWLLAGLGRMFDGSKPTPPWSASASENRNTAFLSIGGFLAAALAPVAVVVVTSKAAQSAMSATTDFASERLERLRGQRRMAPPSVRTFLRTLTTFGAPSTAAGAASRALAAPVNELTAHAHRPAPRGRASVDGFRFVEARQLLDRPERLLLVPLVGLRKRPRPAAVRLGRLAGVAMERARERAR